MLVGRRPGDEENECRQARPRGLESSLTLSIPCDRRSGLLADKEAREGDGGPWRARPRGLGEHVPSPTVTCDRRSGLVAVSNRWEGYVFPPPGLQAQDKFPYHRNLGPSLTNERKDGERPRFLWRELVNGLKERAE